MSCWALIDIVSCKSFDQSTLIVDKPAPNPATTCLEQFSESDYTQLRQLSLSSSPLGGDSLRSVAQSRIPSYIFANVPLGVIKMKLIERSMAVDCLVKTKLENATKDEYSRSRARDEIISKWVEDIARYAILSHTWGVEEPDYQDFHQSSCHGKQGYKKLDNFCNIAHEDYNLEFAWADTVGIDKSSSAELDESIRSMSARYHNAAICIAYVGQTTSLPDLAADRWFTRGWTLQELLAPSRSKFHNKDWLPLTHFRNDKIREEDARMLSGGTYSLQFRLLSDAILTATGIKPRHFRDFEPGFVSPSLPERMKWVARRLTTRSEDKLYCMMGVFGVGLLVAYGEGPERAFFRLFQAILDVACERHWFLWAGKAVPRHIHPSRMIPSGPECYLSSNLKISALEALKMSSFDVLLSLTNVGLSMRLLVVPAHVAPPHDRDSPSDLRVYCSLFNDIAMVKGTPLKSSTDEFALGIFGGSPVTLVSGLLERVYAILLRRISSRTNWERYETDAPLTFRFNDRFGDAVCMYFAKMEWTIVGNREHQ
ncbi:hypothetical protein F5J12DRAFT_950137 [Pisolithus orientalis]|uniref:uncharacterized protein n=1 Tax=Pisolithus orientalis TaxID=936130 RepID=UPI002224C0F2|nr:uncharacterized protein F5J12DRAFT_950137 [Pisolithus orientalis]KAI6001022.1 hypothetical protein F5J12DRAFT_950137 [Pisolithus orientalis]